MTTKTQAKPKPLELDGCHWIATEGSILVPEVRAVCVTIGIVLKSQKSGFSNNWRAAAGRSKQLRKRTMMALHVVSADAVRMHLQDGGFSGPSLIAFTRMAPRRLDDDNLASVFKPIRDQVVAWLAGRNETDARADDGMRSGYTFTYHQQQQRAYGVRIELAP